jgi:hypothetical protein
MSFIHQIESDVTVVTNRYIYIWLSVKIQQLNEVPSRKNVGRIGGTFSRVPNLGKAVIAQSVQRWVTGWTIGFDSRRGLGIILFTTAVSRTALGPTQPPS